MMIKVLSLLCTTIMAAPFERFFTTKLDHAAGPANPKTFKIRYLIDTQYWTASQGDPNKTRPILFYAGNEGDIWGFYENSGFMTTTLAEEMGALVVFAEHRYFGESFPYDRKVAFNAGNN
jgi:lysosomal Pro-X carboxypeptidase